MTVTKTWEVTNLTRDVRDGYVYVIEFEATATEGAEEIGKTRGEVAFMNRPSPLPSDFINYADLDKDTVLGWVKTQLGTDKVTEIETTIELLNKLAYGKPW